MLMAGQRAMITASRTTAARRCQHQRCTGLGRGGVHIGVSTLHEVPLSMDFTKMMTSPQGPHRLDRWEVRGLFNRHDQSNRLVHRYSNLLISSSQGSTVITIRYLRPSHGQNRRTIQKWHQPLTTIRRDVASTPRGPRPLSSTVTLMAVSIVCRRRPTLCKLCPPSRRLNLQAIPRGTGRVHAFLSRRRSHPISTAIATPSRG